MTTAELEKRLEALEEEVAQLRKGHSKAKSMPWWEEIAGTFAKDPVYAKAMEYGRAYRRSTRPRVRRGQSLRHGGAGYRPR